MAEIEFRPRVRTAEVEYETAPGTKRKRKGANLDDVLRAIIWDLKRTRGWKTTTEAAKHLGLPQSTLARILDEGLVGTTVETVSKLCVVLKLSPISLFQLHERYSPSKRLSAGFAEDLVFDQFRAVLDDRGEASRVLRVLEVLKDLGLLEQVLDLAERLLPGALQPQESPQVSNSA